MQNDLINAKTNVRRWGNIVFLTEMTEDKSGKGMPTLKDMDTMEAVALLSAALEEALNKVRMEEQNTPLVGISFD